MCAEILDERLEIKQHVRVAAHVLAHLIDHEEQAEVVRLARHISLDFADQLRDAEFLLAAVIEPVPRRGLAHAQHLGHGRHDLILKEGKGIPRILPAVAIRRRKGLPEGVQLALARKVLLQPRRLEILAVVTQMIVEHLREDAQHSRLVLVDGALDVDVEEDGLRLALRRLGQEMLQLRRLREFLLKAFAHLIRGRQIAVQQIGEDFEKVRFTTAEETRNPDADIRRGLGKCPSIRLQEGAEMLAQLVRDDVLVHLLADDLIVLLVDFDDTVDGTVDILGEHLLYFHAKSVLCYVLGQGNTDKSVSAPLWLSKMRLRQVSADSADVEAPVILVGG